MPDKIQSTWENIRPFFVLLILLACTIMLFYGFKETDVKLSDDQMQITGMYGLKIAFDEVESITLLEKSMNEIGVGTRTNGFGGFGSTLKGNFESASQGMYILFVNSSSSPTIRIERSAGVNVYISFNDGQKTEDLFSELMKWKTK